MPRFGPSLDSARDRRAQGLVACVACSLPGTGVEPGIGIETPSPDSAPSYPSSPCSEAAVWRPGEAGIASRRFSVLFLFVSVLWFFGILPALGRLQFPP